MSSTSTPATRRSPAIAVLRLDSGLFFATAEALEERVRELVEADGDAPVAVVLDLGGVNFIDSQGAEKLTEIQRPGRERRRHAPSGPRQTAGLRGPAGGRLRRSTRLADHIHGNVDRAVEAQLNG